MQNRHEYLRDADSSLVSLHVLKHVETHLRAASTWGFDIPDVTKCG